MISTVILCLSLFQTPEALVPRVETLRFHVERLGAITVPGELQQEKETRLAALKQMLDAPIADDQAFNACYDAIDSVRQWLWAHAAERPLKPVPTFSESPAAWSVHNDTLTLNFPGYARECARRVPGSLRR